MIKHALYIQKIAITGSTGVIGTALRTNLPEYEIIPLDRPQIDCTDYEQVVKGLAGCDCVIHLAHNSKHTPDNSLMTENVYRAALAAKVPRVIMASSVHADNFYTWKNKENLTVNHPAVPDSPYGADKIFMEALGKYYATQGVQVICIRFGGVNAADKQPENDFWESAVWLRHEDLLSMIRACINAPSIPNNFAVFYAVSNNKDRVHDTSNPFGWKPTQS